MTVSSQYIPGYLPQSGGGKLGQSFPEDGKLPTSDIENDLLLAAEIISSHCNVEIKDKPAC